MFLPVLKDAWRQKYTIVNMKQTLLHIMDKQGIIIPGGLLEPNFHAVVTTLVDLKYVHETNVHSRQVHNVHYNVQCSKTVNLGSHLSLQHNTTPTAVLGSPTSSREP
jgi:hypothetical protein